MSEYHSIFYRIPKEKAAFDKFCMELYEKIGLAPPWVNLRDGARWDWKRRIGLFLSEHERVIQEDARARRKKRVAPDRGV